MVTTFSLLTCSLVFGQAPDRQEWLLAPQYAPGLELVYGGSYVEKSLIPNVQHRKEYRLETTILIMDGAARQ